MSKEKPINLEVLPELEEYIVPLQKDEYTQLEKNIIKEGCREPLIVWPRTKTKILIDGHNRYWIPPVCPTWSVCELTNPVQQQESPRSIPKFRNR